MRVTQNMMTRNYLRDMNRNLGRLTKSEERMIGQKYNKASENMADTSRAMRVRQQLYDNEQYLVNIRDANGRLSSAESNIMSINDIMVTAREQLIQKGLNDPNKGEREILAQQLESMQKEIAQFADSQYATAYLFGGTENGQAAFQEVDGRLSYNGVATDDIFKNPDDGKYYTGDPDDDTTWVQVKESGTAYFDVGLGLTLSGDQVDARSAFEITFSGLEVLGYGKNEDGVTNNLYNLLGDAVQLLRTEPLDRGALEAVSTNMKAQTDRMMLSVTDIGAKCQFLEKCEERLENDNLNLQTLQQKLEVTDMTKESINWKTYTAVMMATYQFGSQVLPVSLMDFIK